MKRTMIVAGLIVLGIAYIGAGFPGAGNLRERSTNADNWYIFQSPNSGVCYEVFSSRRVLGMAEIDCERPE